MNWYDLIVNKGDNTQGKAGKQKLKREKAQQM